MQRFLEIFRDGRAPSMALNVTAAVAETVPVVRHILKTVLTSNQFLYQICCTVTGFIFLQAVVV